MVETKDRCACGGVYERDDEMVGSGDRPVCIGCGAVQETCIGCGRVPNRWAVNGSVCETCGEGCVNGSIHINLTDSQQAQLLAWADSRGLYTY